MWGPLFPWNPIKIGYTTIKSPKATVYVDDMTQEDSIVYDIQQIVKDEEKFHGLNYTRPFKIIVLSKDSQNKRYLPWMNGSSFSVSLSPLNLIYIGKNARKSPNGIGPHLKHELSHLLIDQNTSLKKAMKIHKQVWLVEGIAELFSGHTFYSKEELTHLINQNPHQIPILKEQTPQNMSWKQLQLEYSYYRYFMEFLIENYGLEKMHRYIKRYIDAPLNYKKSFLGVYPVELGSVFNAYNIILLKD